MEKFSKLVVDKRFFFFTSVNVRIVSVMFLAVLCFGCVSEKKARARAAAAFMAGQQEAMARTARTRNDIVTFIGPVRNPTVTWSDGMTLSQAILAAQYGASHDPSRIVIVRNGQAIPVDPKRLLGGEDVTLQGGDMVQIQE